MAIDYRTELEYTEFLDGVGYPKVSPRRKHAVLQTRFACILTSSAGDRGEVGTEWDAVVKDDTKLIPDISFWSRERLNEMIESEAEQPPFAPDIAIEVRSPGDNLDYLQRKIARYLANGSVLVLDIEPIPRRITAYSQSGSRSYKEGDTFEHPSAPWLTFPLHDLFSVLDSRTTVS